MGVKVDEMVGVRVKSMVDGRKGWRKGWGWSDS